MIRYMRERFGARMYFAGNSYEWPRGSISAARRALERAGGTVSGEEYFPLGLDRSALDGLLDRIEAARPDVFVPYFAGHDQAAVLNRLAERGLGGRLAIATGHFDEVLAREVTPDARDGVFASNTYFMEVATDENRRFLERLASFPEVAGLWPRGDGLLTSFGEGAYLCVKAFAAAANLAGSTSSEAVAEALRRVVVDGPQGRVAMDEETQHATVNTYLARCRRDGSFGIVERFGPVRAVVPDRYRHQRIGTKTTLEDDLRLQARMLAHLSEAILLVSAAEGVIVYHNAGAGRLFGWEDGELIGRRFGGQHGEVEATLGIDDREMVRALTQTGRWEGEIEARRSDGASLACEISASAFTHPFHGEVWLLVCRDVTGRRIVELRLQQAHRLAGLGAWEHDLTTNAVWWSPEQYRLFGRAEGSPVHAGSFNEHVHPDDREPLRILCENMLVEGSVETRYRVVRPDGEVRHFHGIATVTRDAAGRPTRVLGSNRDVTAQVLAEESLRRSLEEKETLLREIHHRVKNNLQIVSSFLYFHSKRLRSAEDARALADLRRRILAMTLVHDRLHRSGAASDVEFGEYTRALVKELRQSFGPPPGVRITVRSDPLRLSLERALPLALIVSELVTNVLKYAFEGRTEGEASVEVRRGEDRIELLVDDDGAGFPAGFDHQTGGSFGWDLIRTLVLQLGGSVEIGPGAGAHVRACIPASQVAEDGRR